MWRFDYRFAGKRKTLAMGQYPEVKLSEARHKHEDARRLLKGGIDPSAQRRQEKVAGRIAQVNTFGLIAAEYLDRLKEMGRAEMTVTKNKWLLQDLTAPLKDRPITQITPAEILHLLQSVERSGRRETAHRLRSAIGSVFRHAIKTLRAEIDPTATLKGALVPVKVTSRAALIDEAPFGRLLAIIDDYDGWPTLTKALQFTALTFQRPGEVRLAEWKEIDGDVWRIPETRTKMRRPHDVPLSKQALAVLDDIRPLTSGGRLIFPSVRSQERPLSENGMNSALRRMGVTKTEHTAHGFRASASTILNGRGYRHDVIEAQLAHIEPNQVRRAYNRAQYWPERVALMQDWADLCDNLKRPKRDNSDLI